VSIYLCCAAKLNDLLLFCFQVCEYLLVCSIHECYELSTGVTRIGLSLIA